MRAKIELPECWAGVAEPLRALMAKVECEAHADGSAPPDLTAVSAWIAIAWLAAAADASPGLIVERAVVVGRVDDGPWTDAPTEARADQKAELAAVVIGRRGQRRVVAHRRCPAWAPCATRSPSPCRSRSARTRRSRPGPRRSPAATERARRRSRRRQAAPRVGAKRDPAAVRGAETGFAAWSGVGQDGAWPRSSFPRGGPAWQSRCDRRWPRSNARRMRTARRRQTLRPCRRGGYR